MKIKRFNENINNDSMYAISYSFHRVKEELDLLHQRLKWVSNDNEDNDKIDKFYIEIGKIKNNLDELKHKYDKFDNKFFGR